MGLVELVRYHGLVWHHGLVGHAGLAGLVQLVGLYYLSVPNLIRLIYLCADCCINKCPTLSYYGSVCVVRNCTNYIIGIVAGITGEV